MKTFKAFPTPTPTPTPSPTQNRWGVFIGLALILLGISIGATSKLSTLTCERVEINQITCSSLEEDLLELNVEEKILEKVQKAEVLIRVKTEGEVEKLVLIGDKEELPLEAFNGDAKQAATTINDFILDLNEDSVTLRQDDRWFSCFFGTILAIAGLFQAGLFKFSKPRALNRP